MLIKLNNDWIVRKKLSFDLILYLINIFFLNQVIRCYINTQEILPLGRSHFLHRNLLKQILQSRIQF